MQLVFSAIDDQQQCHLIQMGGKIDIPPTKQHSEYKRVLEIFCSCYAEL